LLGACLSLSTPFAFTPGTLGTLYDLPIRP
jgi:hypothetical protein